MTKLTKKWFTLIEMLIVIVIIGILAWVLIPKIGWAREKAEDVAVKANVKALSTAAMQYEMSLWSIPTLNQLSWSSAESKYWAPTIDSTKRTNYSLTTGWTNKYTICGKVSDTANWNASTTWYSETFTDTTWDYYCITY